MPVRKMARPTFHDLIDLHDRPPPADAYLAALREMWERERRDRVLRVLDAMLASGGEGGAVRLAEEVFGEPHDILASGPLGRLGHHVADALGVREKGNADWFAAIATGERHEDGFHWRLHESFIEALRRFPSTASLPGWAGMKDRGRTNAAAKFLREEPDLDEPDAREHVSKTPSPTASSQHTWLFQADIERFDIDAFLATRPAECLWLVTERRNEVAPGDRVFLWRSVARDPEARSGVVAEAVIASAVVPQPDDPASHSFWRNPADADAVRDRVLLRLVRIAGKREVIQRPWVKEDPVLHDLRVLRLAVRTNYEVPPHQAARLAALWSRMGEGWSYAEAVAALWAYGQTLGQEVSQAPGSPVAEVALAIGRTVNAVRAKVMNYRDPAMHAGLFASSPAESEIWARLHDPATGALLAEELDREYQRLWLPTGEGQGQPVKDAAEVSFAPEVEPADALGAPHLAERLGAEPKREEHEPVSVEAWTRRFERDPELIALAKERAGYRCEVPGCAHSTFEVEDGLPYMEVHHIEPLAAGGADTAENVACICPAHHREAHHGRRADAIRTALVRLRAAEVR